MASIGPGLCVLVGVGPEDTEADAVAMADKLAGMRVFSDAEGRMNLDVRDVGGEVLVVSQFTLLADTRRGRRPSFTGAAQPDLARSLIEVIADRLRETGLATSSGVFGARMEVDLVNDGPVTLVLDIRQGRVVA
jgi:D-aminoacyl-tRNA deacylase